MVVSSSIAEGRQCKVNEVILTSRIQGLAPVSQVKGVTVKRANEDFSNLLIEDLIKSKGQRSSCPTVNSFCHKLARMMKKQGASAFRKVHRSYCEENITVKSSRTPNDTYLSAAWGMSQASGVDAKVADAWDVTTGKSSVVVAIVDSGVYVNHPDLKKNIWKNPREIAGNNKDDDGNGYVDDVNGISTIDGVKSLVDENGHGTHVAGIIGAVGNNNRGVVGVNWKVSMMVVRMLDADGSGDLSDALEAYRYILQQKRRGINVVAINNSWGAVGSSSSLAKLVKSAESRGIISVAAAGNETSNNDNVSTIPAGIDTLGLISVASVDSLGNLSSFSNYGETVDIAAPGDEIASTYLKGKYVYLSGTSMAAPFVTGAIALTVANQGKLSVAEMRSRIVDRGTTLSSLSGAVGSGKMLNVLAAVQ